MVHPRRRAGCPLRVGGALVGVSICEDVWSADGPVPALGRAGADVVVNLNASPYSRGRRSERLAMLRERVAEAGCAIAYVNQVGGQDELVFDGASLVVGPDGELLAAGLQFAEDLVVVDVPVRRADRPDRTGLPTAMATPGRATAATATAGTATAPIVEVTGPIAGPGGAKPPLPVRPVPEPLSDVAEVYEALVLGTRDYLGKNGFPTRSSGCPAGSTRRWWPRWRSTRSARTTSTGCRCRRGTRARVPGPTRTTWPSGSASTSASCRSRRPTCALAALLAPCSAAHRPG